MNRLIIVPAFLLVLSSHASAAENYSADYKTCIDKSEGVTSSMLTCNQDELKKQDARLNKNYKLAMSALSAEQKINLRDTQRLWLKYKEANCGMQATLTGGTIDMLFSSGCELDMTQERADTLEWLSNVDN